MRRLKKEFWPNKISVTVTDNFNPTTLESWLLDNLGKFRLRWNVVYYRDHNDYYFQDHHDAAFFSLRWL